MLNRFFLAAVVLIFSAVTAFAQEPFALVELFASEGCSSCLPADDLLSRLVNETTNNQHIFFLNFPVDYWNNLGWIDPFSNPLHSQRQYAYSHSVGISVYTPQMVINGQNAFIGSDEFWARKYIAQWLQRKPSNGLKLTLDSKSARTVELSYTCEHLNPNLTINFALVEDGIESHVDAGENEGKVLKHDHLVREFRTLELSQKQGQESFPILSSKGNGHFAIIAFLQDKQDMRIEAADQLKLQ